MPQTSGLPEWSEHYYRPHRRALRIEDGDTVFYSIDIYRRLQETPPGSECLDSRIPGVSLCYYKPWEDCRIVIVKAPGRVEAVNLRFVTNRQSDPGVERAVELCMERLEQLEEVLRPPERG
jgi:hypothetical protein